MYRLYPEKPIEMPIGRISHGLRDTVPRNHRLRRSGTEIEPGHFRRVSYLRTVQSTNVYLHVPTILETLG